MSISARFTHKVDPVALQVSFHIGWVCSLIAAHVVMKLDLKLLNQLRHHTCRFLLSTCCTFLATLHTAQIVLWCRQLECAFAGPSRRGIGCLKLFWAVRVQAAFYSFFFIVYQFIYTALSTSSRLHCLPHRNMLYGPDGHVPLIKGGLSHWPAPLLHWKSVA